MRFSWYFGGCSWFSGGVPGFLGKVFRVFRGVFRVLGGVPGFLGVPGRSSVPVFLEVLHAITLSCTIFHEKGTPFIYLLLTNGTPFTYLVCDFASLLTAVNALSFQ